MELLSDPAVWASFLTLAALEIVLGIDNLVFISIITARLPPERRSFARRFGLLLALALRILLLFSIAWIVRLTTPILVLGGQVFSWRDLVLLAGGLFLLVKATLEIHHDVEGHGDGSPAARPLGFGSAIAQIAVLDLVFSLDSIITAVGMAEHVEVMVAAVVVAILVMMVAADPVGRFVLAHPTVKMLALAFLLLVGVALVAEGFGFHIPRGYLYFAIAFSALVEGLNQLARRRRARRRPGAGDGETPAPASGTADGTARAATDVAVSGEAADRAEARQQRPDADGVG